MQWTLYVLGSFGSAALYTTLLVMHLYRYDPGQPNPYGWPVLASSILVGAAAMSSRFLSPVAGLVVGYLSDQTRHQWGRRRPFMAIAIVPMLVGFLLVFIPPLPYTSPWNAAYLAFTLLVFFLAFSAYMTPYLALINEMAHTPQQRMHLSTLIAILNLLGTGLGLVIAPWLVERLGFLNMALSLGGLMLMAVVAPLAIKENPCLPSPKPLPFWSSLKTVVQNTAFRSFITSQFQMWIMINIIFVCSNYFVVALLKQEIGSSALVNGVALGGAATGFVLVNGLTKHWGKKATLRLALLGIGCGLLSVGIWPVWLRETEWLWLILLTLFGVMLSGLFILPNAILADIVDQDTNEVGVQRGAIYFGTQAMVVAISSGLASLIAGTTLMLGKTPLQPLGVQVVYPIAGLLALGSAWSLKFYPIEK
jgi:glycoside/pentoside/hexuronide:cation symporter, GPH family